MNTPDTVQQQLLSLLPPEVAVCHATGTAPDGALLPRETESTAGMVEQRRTEFALGRYCAHETLAQLGIHRAPVLKGDNREPVWPAGVVGSITHSSGHAIAAVARNTRLSGLGIDFEGSAELTPAEAELICLPAENTPHDGARAKLLFSAKEAVYKCLYPTVGAYIDFLEMEIFLDEATGSFSAKPHSAKCDPMVVARIQGRYRKFDNWVLATAWIPA